MEEETPTTLTLSLHTLLEWLTTLIYTSYIFLAMLGLLIFKSVHEKLTNKGPTLWPIIGIIPSLIHHFHEIHDWNVKMLKINGGSYRFRGLCGGFEGIMTCDPVNIEYILKNKFKNFPKGKAYRERFNELLGNGIFNADDDDWKEQRRVATMEMKTSRFLNYSLSTMQKLVHDKLLKVIEKQVQLSKDHTMDLQELLLRFTFDNVCIAAFGIDPDCLSLNLPNIPFATAFEEATEYSLLRFLIPPFIWKTMRFFNLGKEKKLKKAVKIVNEFAETTVKNRKADINKPKNNLENNETCDLLSRLANMQDYDGKNDRYFKFSDRFLKDFCISFILAGRDTSSVALVWFFWLLHKNPHVETKILHEIKQILSQRSEENSKESAFGSEELDKMVYLHAAISESVRLYPSVPIDLKQAKVDEVLPNGMRVKKGNRVLYHVYSIGRFESIWGKDCLEFKPERWLNEDGKFVSENQFKYAVFNAGPRLCIGKKFAYMQMKMVAASVLLRYRVKVIDGQVIVPKFTTTLYMKHGMLVTFEPRMG